jgi:hypothetical protein
MSDKTDPAQNPLSSILKSSQEPLAQPTRRAKIVKRTVTTLWIFCALVIPCFFPLVSLDPQAWWKVAGLVLFGLSWFIPIFILFVVLQKETPGEPARAKLTKLTILGVLLSWWSN